MCGQCECVELSLSLSNPLQSVRQDGGAGTAPASRAVSAQCNRAPILHTILADSRPGLELPTAAPSQDALLGTKETLCRVSRRRTTGTCSV